MDDQPLSPSRPVMRYHGGKYRLADWIESPAGQGTSLEAIGRSLMLTGVSFVLIALSPTLLMMPTSWPRRARRQ